MRTSLRLSPFCDIGARKGAIIVFFFPRPWVYMGVARVKDRDVHSKIYLAGQTWGHGTPLAGQEEKNTKNSRWGRRGHLPRPSPSARPRPTRQREFKGAELSPFFFFFFLSPFDMKLLNQRMCSGASSSLWEMKRPWAAVNFVCDGVFTGQEN